jgi:hypothetical protein
MSNVPERRQGRARLLLFTQRQCYNIYNIKCLQMCGGVGAHRIQIVTTGRRGSNPNMTGGFCFGVRPVSQQG